MNQTPTRREIPGYKSFRLLNTGMPAQLEIPLYSKVIRHMRITNITLTPQKFNLYILTGDVPTAIPPITGEKFYINSTMFVPNGVSLEYDADDIYLLPNTRLIIETFQNNAFSIIYRLD